MANKKNTTDTFTGPVLFLLCIRYAHTPMCNQQCCQKLKMEKARFKTIC